MYKLVRAVKFQKDRMIECEEILGAVNPVVRYCQLSGGKTVLRFNDCINPTVEYCTLTLGLGPLVEPDPDGQCIDFINCSGVITVRFNKLDGGVNCEDVVGFFYDKPRQGRILFTDNEITGRGDPRRTSTTSCCCDGPAGCVPAVIANNKFHNSRCAISLASGKGHAVYKNTFGPDVDTQVYNPLGGNKITEAIVIP